MKKQIIVTIISLIPTMGLAKVTDFNALISENVKSQKVLHSAVKQNVLEARDGTQDSSQIKYKKVVVVDSSRETYNAPTKKDLLIFEKEKNFHRASDTQQFDRLATELSSVDSE